MVLPSAMPLFDKLAFILGDSPEAGDSEAGKDEKDSNGSIASGEPRHGRCGMGTFRPTMRKTTAKIMSSAITSDLTTDMERASLFFSASGRRHSSKTLQDVGSHRRLPENSTKT